MMIIQTLIMKKIVGSTEDKGKDMIFCSFCGKTEDEATHIIVGPSTKDADYAICDDCVEICVSIIFKAYREKLPGEK